MISRKIVNDLLGMDEDEIMAKVKNDAKAIRGDTFIFDHFAIRKCSLFIVDFENTYVELFNDDDSNYIASLLTNYTYMVSCSSEDEDIILSKQLKPLKYRFYEHDGYYYRFSNVRGTTLVDHKNNNIFADIFEWKIDIGGLYESLHVSDEKVLYYDNGLKLSPNILKYIPEFGQYTLEAKDCLLLLTALLFIRVNFPNRTKSAH